MSNCETIKMTPTAAKNLLSNTVFDLQRPVRESNVIRLSQEMQAGRFIPGTPIYFAELPDGTMLALNGQHTLHAVTRGTGPVELTIIHHAVANRHEAAALYSRFDIHRIRSWRDSLRAHGAESMLANSTVWTSSFAGGVSLMLCSFNDAVRMRDRTLMESPEYVQAYTSRDLRLKIMRDAQPSAELYADAVGGLTGPKSIFKRAAVMGPAVEILRYQPSAGTEFFATMAADDGLRSGDPQRALLRYLRQGTSAGAAARTNIARAVAAAWNAFFQGRRIEHVKPSLATNFRLAGTPWEDPEFDPVKAYLPELFEKKPELRRGKGRSNGDATIVPIAAAGEGSV